GDPEDLLDAADDRAGHALEPVDDRAADALGAVPELDQRLMGEAVKARPEALEGVDGASGEAAEEADEGGDPVLDPGDGVAPDRVPGAGDGTAETGHDAASPGLHAAEPGDHVRDAVLRPGDSVPPQRVPDRGDSGAVGVERRGDGMPE